MWQGQVYVNWVVMFELPSSAGVFGSIVDMLVVAYKAAGFCSLLKWVNDFFVIHFPHQCWSEQEFMDLTGVFGVPWSSKKTCPFSTLQQYISFNWDLTNCIAAVPLEKLAQIITLLNLWLSPDNQFSPQKAGAHFMHFPSYPPLSAEYSSLSILLQIVPGKTPHISSLDGRSLLDLFSNLEPPRSDAFNITSRDRSVVVG